jgi:hypothetical protein
MIKNLLSALFLVCVVAVAGAQTTILDFQTPETSTVFQYFGSTLDGTFNDVVANPDPSGENTSDSVAVFVKPAVAEVWAGGFSNPNPTYALDLTSNNGIAIKVYMDHIGSLSLKLEGSTDGGDNWITTVANTQVNQWETLVFDPTLPSIEGPFTAAAGHTYTRVVLFFDFGTPGTGVDVTNYFDDVVVLPPPVETTTVLDFEAPETSTVFQYFGSAQDGTFTQVVANPNPSGDNTSANVSNYVKPAVAEVWAGAFSNPDPATPVNLDNGGQVCVKVLMDHIGNLALKLEGSTSGQANWITTVANTKVGEWDEICFDASLPSIESPFTPATGTYTRIVLFFDFGAPGIGTDVTSYFDDVVVKASAAPQIRTISFKVDMNQYSENFDQVYLSGTFNNWSGDANPLSDPEFDGIWEGSLELPNGLYEYKVTLDNWGAQENFIGTEECTQKDPSGQFTNRRLAVSEDREIPQFCYNSCYACGEEVVIQFKLGFDGVTPSPDGVWLAGGGNFDVPGGKYQMHDNDGDGIYEITVPRARNFSSFYTFANGNCPDYSCKENLAGLECGDPDNFNDRFLPAVTEDSEVGTCFGTCAIDALCTVGTQTLQKDESVFSLHGNPSSNGFSILYFGVDALDEKWVSVSNSLGQEVAHWRVAAGVPTFNLPTSELQHGMYLVTVKVDNRFYSRKLVN